MREENGGGDVRYYALDIKYPKRFKPCTVECEDVIRALGLNFFEGEAFKAIWRKGAQRTFGVGKAGNTALRDAQKMAHYGARELAHEQHREYAGLVAVWPQAKGAPDGLWREGDAVKYRGSKGEYFSPGDTCIVCRISERSVSVRGSRGVEVTYLAGSLVENFEWVSRP